ncbi:kinesin-like protein KIN-8A isoform X2 [Nymphaea colorata]|uniref:kinesin-like protein KIN-8A isoform X2 n=1 Tax=Nymphaea colorata TaxID=210225 RepID=UPI00129E1146|nr:kinesin-like protein KIN-8A isoform X2 [Nymphaea colorata]
MPVSTRSHILTTQDDSNQKARARIDRRQDQEDLTQPVGSLLKNPHHGLKEKMKALTVLYEQQVASKNTAGPRTEDRKRYSTHPSVDLVRSGRRNSNGGASKEDDEALKKQITRADTEIGGRRGNIMKENAIYSGLKTEKRSTVVAEDLNSWGKGVHAKENMMGLERMGLTCPRPQKPSAPSVVRRLSMTAAVPQPEDKVNMAQKTGNDLGAVPEISDIGSRILVFVRLRPMSKKEKEAGSHCSVKIPNKRDVYLTEHASENDYLRLKRLRGRHFTFDASFPDSTTQQEVYTTTTADLVEGVLQGRNGSVFCYGATGAGKTYTMLGTLENPGVMVLAIKDLFSKIRQRSFDGNHVVHLSYLEVYNETVRDLLSPGRPLVLREDKQGIVASGLTQYRAYSTDEVMALLQQGNQNRTTEPTRVNETSSRSHAILQVVAEYRVKDACNKVVNRVGKLSLIDLAGSERALATDQRTVRSIEGANINRSLLALSSCINALVEGKKHIPYRNSKLTQLLKDSLGGYCNTVMIANISPSSLCFGETQNTLHWADRAKEIRTKACEFGDEGLDLGNSEFGSDQAKLLLEVQKENRELRTQLARCQQKLLTAQAQSLAANAAASPAPSAGTAASPLLSPAGSVTKKERRRTNNASSLCPPTPEPEIVRKLKQTVQTLESEIEKMKRDHALQLRQKDDFIRELCQNRLQKEAAVATEAPPPSPPLGNLHTVDSKAKKASLKSNCNKHVLTRCCGAASAAVRTARRRAGTADTDTVEGQLKSPSHRFVSPVPTAKKRSFWDITTANSPSVALVNGRSTRSHVAATQQDAPSMLLQPGFARQRPAVSSNE